MTRWWGKGFTEWTNVTLVGPYIQGAPSAPFAGRPGILRPPAARYQAGSGRPSLVIYGTLGFCYYHYWFLPSYSCWSGLFQEVLVTGRARLPILPPLLGQREMESAWDGLERNVLDGYDRATRPRMTWRTSAGCAKRSATPGTSGLKDDRCSWADCASDLPDTVRTTSLWCREEAIRQGVG